MFFGLFDSVDKKMRTNAANWLELSQKVYHYRRDLMPASDLRALQQATETVRQQLRDKADSGKLKLGIESLEAAIRRVGGTHYPKSGWVENVEFFLVAAIVILGVRSYFIQPFKIPTNSMWPSYYGMTPEVYAKPADEPGVAERAFRFLTLGAIHREVDASSDGEVLLPLDGPGNGLVKYDTVPGRSWLVFPALKREYNLPVGDGYVTVRVPQDFDFDWVIRDTFFPGAKSSQDVYDLVARDRNRIVARDVVSPDGAVHTIHYIRTGRYVRAGDRVFSFDILTGDQLFVDRLSYNFVRPRIGDGFVFHTGNIPALAPQGDQYYIKRLVGAPGDHIAIKPPVLWRNGAPIAGAAAFGKNANREGLYRGYFNGHPDDRYPDAQLFPGQTIQVPAHFYLPLGDNSADSLDGRYWGFVNEKDVVGRPLFVYYPFTRRWGLPN